MAHGIYNTDLASGIETFKDNKSPQKCYSNKHVYRPYI